MPAPRKRRRFGQDYTSAAFKPYALALGQLTLAWNDLQESLAALFWTLLYDNELVESPIDMNYAPLHLWYSVRSDRSQRQMLRAWIVNSKEDFGRDRFKKDALWLIDKAESLENDRNNAIHSPLFDSKLSLWVGLTTKERIAPAGWLQNPRATQLLKKTDLLEEFRWCRDTALNLADFAHAIDDAIVSRSQPWPDRPALPNRQQ